MNANKRYKASVFSLLFGNAETLRELYGAITGTNIPPDVPISINTLEDVLFMEQINDLSFSITALLSTRCGSLRHDQAILTKQ
ncbi:MAG: hypothetical protein LBS97_07200 [Treponema sp.]|jgi:glutamate mutase epsilon subunit|nr:hypothetical protein [Treponema sp.]